MRRCFWLSIVSALCLAFAQSGGAQWKLGILDGYRMFSIGPKDAAPSASIDLRRRWDANIFFRSERQLEKQGHAYPRVFILGAAPNGTFLATLGGLEYRDDGPLVLGEIGTGKILRAFPVSGAAIDAAFVPPDGRRVVVSWSDASGGLHKAAFDASTGEQVAELPPGQLPQSGYLFSESPPTLLFIPESPDGEIHYQLLPADTWRDGRPLALPAGNYTVLDLRKDTLLLESRDTMIHVNAWSRARPGSFPVAIKSREYGGEAAIRYFLAGGGQRVVEWTEGLRSSELVVYDSATGHTTGRLKINGRIRAHALDPSETTIALAVDRSILFISAWDATLNSRKAAILSGGGDLSLFCLFPENAKTRAAVN